MPRYDDAVSLRQMRDYALAARNFIHGRNRPDLDADLMLALALTRALEVIGEAANRISPATRSRLPDIPWQEMICFGDRLIR